VSVCLQCYIFGIFVHCSVGDMKDHECTLNEDCILGSVNVGTQESVRSDHRTVGRYGGVVVAVHLRYRTRGVRAEQGDGETRIRNDRQLR
jgi:hypothetical protein